MSASLHELADEYVIGLLDEAESRDVERRMRDEPELEAAVLAARERFLEIDLTEKPAGLSDSAWTQIVDRLGESAGDDTVVPIGQARAKRAASGVPAYWKHVAQAGMAACLLLVVGLGWIASRPAPQFVAVLLDSGGEPQAVIEAYADDHVVVLPLENFAVPEGRTLQVWTKPNTPDAQPVSLGLMEQIRRLSLTGPDLPPPSQGQLYEITIEQEGGSPTGLPTGPIVGKGFAKTAI